MASGHYATQGQTVAAAPERELSVLEKVRSKIEDASSDIHSLAMQVNEIADRAFGPPPPTADEVKPSPVPNGAVGHLEEQIQRLHDTIGFLRSRIARITPLA